jgi:hypothetical protein
VKRRKAIGVGVFLRRAGDGSFAHSRTLRLAHSQMPLGCPLLRAAGDRRFLEVTDEGP